MSDYIVNLNNLYGAAVLDYGEGRCTVAEFQALLAQIAQTERLERLVEVVDHDSDYIATVGDDNDRTKQRITDLEAENAELKETCAELGRGLNEQTVENAKLRELLATEQQILDETIARVPDGCEYIKPDEKGLAIHRAACNKFVKGVTG